MQTCSLKAWLALCATCDIPHIPAVELGSLPVADILRLQDGETVSSDTIDFLHNLPTRLQPRTMVRWDCCAGENLKFALGTGRPDWQPAFQQLVIDDFRLFRILVEDIGLDQSITVWERPWVTPLILNNYPIEVRVFASNGQIQAVSSYYVQRPLPDTPTIQQFCQDAWHLSTRFLPHVSAFTADFMLTETGILFLEGGPPHQTNPPRGAHPCCFAPGQTTGIALAPHEGAVIS
ncbi:MAG: hypothetical protein Q8S75_15750 [Nitrospirota bacterium]|nr:hypothetical protein [Nitrospirota bacterium]